MSRLFKLKKGPAGKEKLIPKITEFEEQLRVAQNDPMYGRRRNETTWDVIKNNYERSKFVYEQYTQQEISKELYDYCVKNDIIDGMLIAKWKKPGFGHLCCLKCLRPKQGSNSVCICRVPEDERDNDNYVRCANCGCTGCASKSKCKDEDNDVENTENEKEGCCGDTKMEEVIPTEEVVKEVEHKKEEELKELKRDELDKKDVEELQKEVQQETEKLEKVDNQKEQPANDQEEEIAVQTNFKKFGKK
ncbi:hypothetical protein EIN_228300 [Entamoeba invadens IP1]|uniref:Uncharacterized protein n=1 Tax=Entamoeba invadens IP1 TaxID=370355 RepID=A0A0A1U2T8_ENTIV|nr:hypothetical protein EIN_228300 [Entamoeba invadens IP1]ELP88367.1 hypothetical protein EIN_228300 [Entamoeba invadens IP1]|eukprot:XP_004255138.1 hypothetical protein EIN_228300 [Entamoeba invadens IP1]